MAQKQRALKPLTNEQFDALANLVRMRKQTRIKEATRLIIVEGRRTPDVAAEFDLFPQSVSNSVTRIIKAWSLVVEVLDIENIVRQTLSRANEAQSVITREQLIADITVNVSNIYESKQGH